MSNHDSYRKHFFERGWCRFEFDEAIAAWIESALPFARKAVVAEEFSRWLRCEGTWFVGVNALPNRADGSVGTGPGLQGELVDFIRQELYTDHFAWDAAQVSVFYPGYPRPKESESEKAFQYRCRRDAAHVDGLLPEGDSRRRHLREHHGFILGIPMVEYDQNTSPAVIWEGSQELVRSALSKRFNGIAPGEWSHEDITDSYHAVRQQVFEQCNRVPIVACPGEAYLIHRLAVHGVAPWRNGAVASADGRMICYFRPEFLDADGWLNSP
ncbi:MAG: hypothetical protein OEY09_10480 [Gammaproteobacteria bacterium]|nr:hypothetical protein [Gammaproteobacteria bacterium]